jgi:2'-5' RNA ligase
VRAASYRKPTAQDGPIGAIFRRAGKRGAPLNGDFSKCLLHRPGRIMPDQLWLPGLEAPPVPTDGLFFAVLPDANTAASIAKLAQQICIETRSKSKLHAANRLHVTLQHLGNFAGGLPQERVDAAIKAAASIRMEPFSVEFDHALSFAPKPRPGPLVLGGSEGVVGLHTLHDALTRALQNAGFGDPAVLPNAAPYTPHVTLAYGMPWIAARPVEAASWNVREFVLMHSLLGRTRHIALARWPLTG